MKPHFAQLVATCAVFMPFTLAYLVDPPSTAGPDTIQDCSDWHVATSQDTCDSIAVASHLTMVQFNTYNPSIASKCNLIGGNSYCTEENFSIPPPPPPTSTTDLASGTPTPTNGIATPSPVQDGITGNCNRFYFVVKDDGCFDISAKFSISTDQFLSWNPATGDNCQGLKAKYYVCIGVIGFVPPSTTPTPTIPSSTQVLPTNGVSTPSPIRNGMTPNCNAFQLIKSGDICDSVAQLHGITVDQLLLWNPSIGNDCKGLWPKTYFCVGVIGMSPPTLTSIVVKPTMARPLNGVFTPTPFQEGMTPNCKRFYRVLKDDGCWAIANKYGVDPNDFVSWNPAVKDDCSGLQPSETVCVGLIGS